MPIRSGSWEGFHRYIRWSEPPRSVVPAVAVVHRPAPRQSPARPMASARGSSESSVGLGDLLMAMWKGFWGGR